MIGYGLDVSSSVSPAPSFRKKITLCSSHCPAIILNFSDRSCPALICIMLPITLVIIFKCNYIKTLNNIAVVVKLNMLAKK